jgi:hypothetical protein
MRSEPIQGSVLGYSFRGFYPVIDGSMKPPNELPRQTGVCAQSHVESMPCQLSITGPMQSMSYSGYCYHSAFGENLLLAGRRLEKLQRGLRGISDQESGV